MTSLVALFMVLFVVAWIAGPELRLELRRAESRLKALWVWRNGRERAVMRGVIRC